MPNQPKTPIIGVRIPDEWRTELERYAEEDGDRLSHQVRRAVQEYIERRG